MSLPFNIPNPFKQTPEHHVPSDSSATPGTKSRIAKPRAGEDESLETLLPTPELRSSLTLLVAAITSHMRTNITAIFDSRYITVELSHSSGSNLPSEPIAEPSASNAAKPVRPSKDKDSIIQDLSRPEVLALKKGVLEHYDGWHRRVLTRVGEIVNSRAQAVAQAKEQTARADPADAQISEYEDCRLPDDDSPRESRRNSRSISSEMMLRELHKPIYTQLNSDLSQEKRRLVLHAVFLMLLSLEHYTAYSRVLLLSLASSLEIPLSVLSEDELSTAQSLLTAVELSADDETQKRAKASAVSRKWKVGLATAAGAALIGVTGGLAAPLVAAGVGTIMGGVGLASTSAAAYLGALAGSEILIAGLFGAYGGRMTGEMMNEFAKEVDDFAFLLVQELYPQPRLKGNHRRLRVAICISGWLTNKEDVARPWRVISPSIEVFALRWELEALLKLGNAMTGLVKSTAWNYAKGELIKLTIFSVLWSALWPLKLIKLARIVDNPFSVAMVRADKAGEVLADALANKTQGERPVTLIGYSLGARVIFACLQRLAQRKQFGLIENAVLLGGPVPASHSHWRAMRSIVAGRLVNVYSENDLILGFLYRAHALEYGAAGLQRIASVKGVENVNVTDIISGHLRYRFLSGSILKKIGFEDLDIDLVQQEENELKATETLEEKERKVHEETLAKQHGDEDDDIKQLEADVEKRNQASSIDAATKPKSSERKSSFDTLWAGKPPKQPDMCRVKEDKQL